MSKRNESVIPEENDICFLGLTYATGNLGVNTLTDGALASVFKSDPDSSVLMLFQAAYKRLGYRKGDFPVCEKTVKDLLSLPMFPELTGESQDRIVELILDFVERTGMLSQKEKTVSG